MEELTVRKAVLPWLAAGLVLGGVQVLAVALAGPLGVSTQFVVADAKLISEAAPDYAQTHPLISKEKYQKFGKGWWLDIGLLVGALVAAIASGRFKIRCSTVWWQASYGPSIVKRFLVSFIGGILILVGARFAHGCTSGQFASGWAQLSFSAVPFTIAMFAVGMITARLFYPKVPTIEK